jgi:hypothetical protein
MGMASGLARKIPATAAPIAVFLKSSLLEIAGIPASFTHCGIVSRFTGHYLGEAAAWIPAGRGRSGNYDLWMGVSLPAPVSHIPLVSA